jgi:hypothetical protein
MNCIDAIEGCFKCTINRIHQFYEDENRDDSVYIRYVKSMLDGLDDFIQSNKELQLIDANTLRKVIYDYAREKWLTSVHEGVRREVLPEDAPIDEESEAYYRYYFEYIYHNGMYPR